MSVFTVEQFWQRLDRTGPDFRGLGPCWEWRTSSGGRARRYGWTRVAGHSGMPHRIAYLIAKGDIPSGLCVLHACDNPRCCNPAHLSVGTQLDNRRQAAERGRTRRKLTELDALDALVATARGESQRSIAARLGVARNTVVCMLTGATFLHVREAVRPWLPAHSLDLAPVAATGTDGPP